jgi:hypothetical protein
MGYMTFNMLSHLNDNINHSHPSESCWVSSAAGAFMILSRLFSCYLEYHCFKNAYIMEHLAMLHSAVNKIMSDSENHKIQQLQHLIGSIPHHSMPLIHCFTGLWISSHYWNDSSPMAFIELLKSVCTIMLVTTEVWRCHWRAVVIW